MKKSAVITIPAPCAERWDEMRPSGQGRHCNACQNTVIDFTAMTDEQVLNVFRHANGHTPCGRFLSSQLNRELIPARKPSLWARVAGKAAALVLLLQSASATVQAQVTKPRATLVQHSNELDNRSAMTSINGRVLDGITSDPLCNYQVSIADHKAVTDSMGCFTLFIPTAMSNTTVTMLCHPADTTAPGYACDVATVNAAEYAGNKKELKHMFSRVIAATVTVDNIYHFDPNERYMVQGVPPANPVFLNVFDTSKIYVTTSYYKVKKHVKRIYKPRKK
jgi:hypothetical protein